MRKKNCLANLLRFFIFPTRDTEQKSGELWTMTKFLLSQNSKKKKFLAKSFQKERIFYYSLLFSRLNGPNTCTDWAIEGRRTIPLLPRLKGHTAFTGLANSLSLVLAAANEKKIPISNRLEDATGNCLLQIILTLVKKFYLKIGKYLFQSKKKRWWMRTQRATSERRKKLQFHIPRQKREGRNGRDRCQR